MPRAYLLRSAVVGIVGQPLLDGSPVEALVPIPVVLGGGDEAGGGETGLLEPVDGGVEADEVAPIDRVGERPLPPVGFWISWSRSTISQGQPTPRTLRCAASGRPEGYASDSMRSTSEESTANASSTGSGDVEVDAGAPERVERVDGVAGAEELEVAARRHPRSPSSTPRASAWAPEIPVAYW